MRQSDTIHAFLNEVVDFIKNGVITRSEYYQNYKNYCDVFGLDPESNRRFTQVMQGTKGISECKIGNERSWKGVRCKKIDEDGLIKDVSSTDSTDSTNNTIQEILKV